MAYDHVNECYVDIFKRIVKRGNSTEEVLNRVSRNLVFMRSTWDGLAVASGTRKKITANRGREDDEAVRICMDYFKELDILTYKPRTMEDIFFQDKSVPKNLNRLHGGLDNRALQSCYSTFLPAFISKMQQREKADTKASVGAGQDVDADEDVNEEDEENDEEMFRVQLPDQVNDPDVENGLFQDIDPYFP